MSSTIRPTASHVAASGQDQGSGFGVEPEVTQWPVWKAFIGGYLPLVLAVIFKLFWTSIYANVKLVEPFVQLSTAQGVSAKDVFHTFYLSSNLTLQPFLALFKGHWLVFWTSLVYVVVALIAPLSAECIFIDTNYGCPNPNPKQPDNPCWPPKLSYDPTVLRALQALLSCIAVMTLAIMVMVMRSHTGLSTDPSSIASITSLVHHPDVLADFRGMQNEASTKDIKAQLGDKRYTIGSYQRPDGVWRYDIMPLIPSSRSPSVANETTHSIIPRRNRNPVFRSALDLGYIFFILGVLGVVVAYFKDGSDSGFNHFFNSKGFGPRFFMVCCRP